MPCCWSRDRGKATEILTLCTFWSSVTSGLLVALLTPPPGLSNQWQISILTLGWCSTLVFDVLMNFLSFSESSNDPSCHLSPVILPPAWNPPTPWLLWHLLPLTPHLPDPSFSVYFADFSSSDLLSLGLPKVHPSLFSVISSIPPMTCTGLIFPPWPVPPAPMICFRNLRFHLSTASALSFPQILPVGSVYSHIRVLSSPFPLLLLPLSLHSPTMGSSMSSSLLDPQYRWAQLNLFGVSWFGFFVSFCLFVHFHFEINFKFT